MEIYYKQKTSTKSFYPFPFSLSDVLQAYEYI
jgi:hypothetical protein